MCALLLILLAPAAAGAQTYKSGRAPHAGSIEIGGAIARTGGYDAGNRSATETPNSASSSASPLTLFTTASTVAAAAGVDARIGIYLSPRISVEGAFQFSHPVLKTRLGDDFEQAAPVTAEETVSSYLAGGSLLYHFGSGRLVPYVAGGAAYIRQLHEDNAVVESGTEVHAGGGVKYWLGKSARRLGLRFDAEESVRSRSVGFEDKRRLLPVLSAGVTYLF